MHRIFICLILLALSLGLGVDVVLAQQSSISPNPTPLQETPKAGASSARFTLHRDANGEQVVTMKDLFAVVESLYPDAQKQWDPTVGVRLKIDGTTFDIMRNRAYVVIDKKPKVVTRNILVQGGDVFIPLSSVQVMFNALGLDLSIKGNDDKVKSPTPEVESTDDTTSTAETILPPSDEHEVPSISSEMLEILSSTPTPLPTPEQTPFVLEPLEVTPTPTPEEDISEKSEVSPTLTGDLGSSTPMPELTPSSVAPEPLLPAQPPSFSFEGSITLPANAPNSVFGLTWSQIVDAAHSTIPKRVVLLVDPENQPVGRNIAKSLELSLGIQMSVIASPTIRRDTASLPSIIESEQPDLFIDISVSPSSAEREMQRFVIWTVHRSLWPDIDDSVKDPLAQRYLKHEVQSLVLGSIMRERLQSYFPTMDAVYELAPAYLLRRVDTPSVMILLPVSTNLQDAGWNTQLVRAIVDAIEAYVRGIEKTGKVVPVTKK